MTFKDMLELQGKPKLRNRPGHEEENMQIDCVKWFDYQYPKLKLNLFHSPLGGKRDKREAARFKAMGARKGFPDLLLLYPNKFYPCMGIELKTESGRQSEEQKEYQRIFEIIGAKYIVVRSLEEFIAEVNNYLKDE